MSKYVSVIIGGAEIAAGVLLLASGNPLGTYLISAGSGQVIAGVGTLLAKGPLTGTGGASRNPIAPWNVVYGRAKVGGTIIYVSEFDDNNKYLDLVDVLACHVCQSVDALMFDGQRVPLDANGCSVAPPSDQTGPNITSITRSNGILTVVIALAITDPAGGPLQDGDVIIIKNVTGDLTMNGRYPVTVVNSTEFTCVCGGADGAGTGGQTETTWPNYKAKVHMEVLLGDHAATFPGMITGTPYDGDTGTPVIRADNPWTADHKLLGKCCAFLRLHYNDEVFANGLPTINFRISGKSDIYDPRTSPPTYAYTENAALCIADYLANTIWGFKAVYGTEIPAPELIAAANVCDEAVDLAAGSTEPRYTCNGQFPLTMKRGEVLQNLLTSCGGRLTYSGGQFVIHPAACVEPILSIPERSILSGTLFVTSSHTLGVPESAVAGFYLGSIGLLAFSNRWLYDGTAWSDRTDSVSLNSDEIAALTAGSLNANFDLEQTIFGDADPPDTLVISDCWIEAVYSDGGSATLRPTEGTATFTANGNVVVALPGGTVTRHHYSALGTPPVLGLSAFQPETVIAAPDVSPDGMAASGVTLADAAGPFRWRQKLAIRDLYNGVKGTYISPTNNWQSSDVPPYAQDNLHGYHSGSPEYSEGDANLAADGGDRRWKDIQLPFTISVSAAQRLCKIELMRIRQQGTGTFVFNMAMYQLTALDVILMTLPILGWTNKQLEIQAHRFTLNKQNNGGQEVTLLGTEIDVQEYDCSIFDWSTAEELTAHGFQQSILPSNVGTLDDIYTVNGT